MTTHNVILPLFQERPEKRYPTLVADPPWHYDHSWNAYRGAGKERQVTDASDYPTMSISELMMMPTGLWARDNAHLYLWTTHAYLCPAHEIAKAWGFDVKAVLTWIKRKARDDEWLGMGTYYRSVTEFVLFCTRGSLQTLRNDQPTFFYGARGRHSEKPDTFYDIVEHMSPGPYLDVFSRKQRFGWDTWGNEAFDFRTDGIWNK